MKFKIIFLLSWIFICSLTNDVIAQPIIEWEQNYGGTGADYDAVMNKVTDGGYVVATTSVSDDLDVGGNNGGKDIWVFKLDQLGVIIWQKNYGGSRDESPHSIIETSDGGFIIVGESDSDDGDVGNNKGSSDMWVLRLNNFGGLLWSRNYGGSGYDAARSVIENDNNEFIVVGESGSSNGDVGNNKGGRDFWILKLDHAGDIIWERNYGGSNIEGAHSIIKNSEDKYIISGQSRSSDEDVSGNNGEIDLWIIQIDSLGDIIWEQNYGGSDVELFESLEEIENGYLISGSTLSNDKDIEANKGGYDYWFLEIDDNGVIRLTKTYGGSVNDIPFTAQKISDGNYIMGGRIGSEDNDVSNNYGDFDIWLVKINSEGEILWEQNYGGSSREFISGLYETSDKGFMVGSVSTSSDIDVGGNYGQSDFWLMKLSPFTTSTNITKSNEEWFFEVYPNPSDGGFTIDLRELKQNAKIDIFNALGSVVYSKMANNYENLYVDHLPKGIYWIRVLNGHSVSTQKVIIE